MKAQTGRAEAVTDAERIAELEANKRQQDEKIKELTQERDELQELLNRMREQVEGTGETIDRWIDVFEMEKGESGDWLFDSTQSKLWEAHDELLTRHRKLIAEWNKFVGRYNAVVNPHDVGRPIAASGAQQADVLTRRKKGETLRGIAEATGLSMRTVRTIVDKATRKGRAGTRIAALRRKEFSTVSGRRHIESGGKRGTALARKSPNSRRPAKLW